MKENILVKRKRNPVGEFFVNLWEYCNLSCNFCWQDHSDKEGMSDKEVRDKAKDIILKALSDPRVEFDINIMGGELFADEIDDSLFNSFISLATLIDTNLKANKKKANINWVTNLVFTKTLRVKELIDKLREYGVNTAITTSYDFSGRFNKDNLTLFKKNLYYYGKVYVRCISVVLTKPNIKKVIQDKDEVFKQLVKDNFYIYFDYYSPELNHQKNTPSDIDLLECFLFLLEKYPNVYPVAGWLKSQVNYLSCRSSVVIGKGGYTGSCKSLLYNDIFKDYKTTTAKKDITSNNDIETTFVKKYNCLECKHYNKCGMSCFNLFDFQKRGQIEECIFKIIYDKIENGTYS